jgi:tetratricopeptide (TPR) repeat protein
MSARTPVLRAEESRRLGHRRVAWALLALALGCALAAEAAPGAAERARAAEEAGKFAEAARLYEAALRPGKRPDLLYRLALCKRHLGDYAGAREALRGYLREEPGGALRVEVERQLAQLQVLIEERGLHPESAPHGAKAATAKPATSPGSGPGAGGGAGFVAATVVPASSGAAPAPSSAAAPAPAPAASPPASTPSPVAVTTALAASAPASATAPATSSAQAASAALPPLARPAAPPSALAPPATAAVPALPFALGAAAAGLTGGLLLWDGARVSSDLDARFSSGDLTAADQSRYTRAHREGAAGVALLSLAVVAAGAAVWLVAF